MMDSSQIKGILDDAASKGASAEQLREIYSRIIQPSKQETDLAETKLKVSTDPLEALKAYAANVTQLVPFSDEIASGVGAALGGGEGDTFGERYGDLQQKQANLREAGLSAQPRIKTPEGMPDITPTGIGQIGGALATAPILPVFSAGKGAGTLAQIGAGAKTGAAYGAVTGAGEGGDLETRAANAALYGGTGGFLGAGAGAIPAVTQGVGKAAQTAKGLYDRIANSGAGAQDIAALQMAKAIREGGLSANMGKNLLQSGNKGVINRAETIATRNNPASDMLYKYAEGRTAELPMDVSTAIGERFAERDYPAVLSAIKEKARVEAKPAYESAYEAMPKINVGENKAIEDVLDQLVLTGKFPQVAKYASEIAAAVDNKKLGNLDIQGRMLSYSTQDLDYLSRGVKKMAEGPEGSSAFGGKFDAFGGGLMNMYGRMRKELANINPLFGKAVSDYADDVGLYNAAQAGKDTNLFGGNWKQAVSDFNKLPPNARQAWLVGQAENLQTKIANNPSAALRQFNSPQFSKVMENFYNPEELGKITAGLQDLAKEQANLRTITANSRTAARSGQQADDAEMLGAGMNVLRDGFGRTMLSKLAQSRLNPNSSPVQQEADAAIVRALLSRPFDLAARGTAGTSAIDNRVLAEILRKGGRSSGSSYSVNPVMVPALINTSSALQGGQ